MKTKIATVPRLVETYSDWYVYFSIRHPGTGKMVPQKIYRGFKARKTRKDKIAWGETLIKEYTAKLKKGWNPIDNEEKVIYSDNIAYSNLAKKFTRKRLSVRNTRYYLSEFLDLRKKDLREKTYTTYQSKLRIFCEYLDREGFGDYDVSEIDRKIIHKFFDFLIEGDLDKVTVRKYMQIIRTYFTWLQNYGKVADNPVVEIKLPPKKKDAAARPINKTDLKKLLDAIKESDPQLYLVCMFEYYTALRPGQEIRLLRVKDIDVYNNTIVITDGQAKTARRVVDMPKQLSNLLLANEMHSYNREFYVFGNGGEPGQVAYGKNNFRNRFNKIRDELKLPDIYKLYSMKHTGLGRLLESGRTLEEIRDHAGHKSIESTDNYIRRHFGKRNKNIINNFPEP